MPTIRQLPPSVVNKIAAGEVIERPASVVKELVENSLDAGASRIDVTVEQGGAELLRVVDDGCGIEAAELPLAVASHATSKLATADDLFRVRSLGFRGEALASIAEISRFRLRSRTRDAAQGAELEVVSGRVGEMVPVGGPVGTSIEVRHLFFNTPVRRKFLKAVTTEMGHISEAFTRLALAAPRVHFTLRHNERTVYDLPPVGSWRERIAAFFGHDLDADLIEVHSADDAVRLSGYVARPNQTRGHARMQYLFLNGRYIRDRALQHALGEAYRGLILTGRFPIAFLELSMPPEAVDVNVHPTKLEVRFEDGGRLYSQVLSTLRTKFLATDLTHSLKPTPAEGPEGALDADRAASVRQELLDWARGATSAATLPAPAAAATVRLDECPSEVLDPSEAARSGPLESSFRSATGSAPWERDDAVAHGGLTIHRIDRAGTAALGAAGAGPAARTAEPLAGASAALSVAPGEVPVAPPAPRAVGRAVQILRRYIVTECDEGMLVIDQHALHERILYERMRASVLAGHVEVQGLLVPEAVDLSAAEAAAVLEQRELIGSLGLRVEPFGGDTVLVTGYPAMLARLRPGDVLRSVAEELVARGRVPDRRDLVDELLHLCSCKAAIKAGDPLSDDELAALVEERHLAQDTHHCPHGRPTALVLSREDLDRQFKRI